MRLNELGSWALLAAAVVVGCGGAPAAGSSRNGATTGTYEIRLARRVEVGLSWSELATSRESQHVRIVDGSGAVLSETEETTSVELAGTYVVLAVDEDGGPTRLRFVPARLTIDAGQGPVPQSLPSALLVQSGSDELVGEHGEPIDPAIADAVHHVVTDSLPGPNADETIGSRTPRAVGASWPVDALAATDSFRAHELGLAAGDVHGESMLVDARTEQGREALLVRTTLRAAIRTIPNLPPSASVDHAEMIASHEGLVPLDPAVPALREAMRIEVGAAMSVATPVGIERIELSSVTESSQLRTLR